MKSNFLMSEAIEDWSDFEARAVVSGIAAFVMMFVSCFLDIVTPFVPTPVWVGLWIGIPILTFILPSIRLLHPANRVKSPYAREALGKYYRLNSDEKALFPANYEQLLRTKDLSTTDANTLMIEGDRLHKRVLVQREKKYSADVSSAIEQIRYNEEGLRQQDEIHAQVMKELA